MEVENPGNMTFDEVSMERSKSFVKALQELKNLRPQLYSAAEYCEKSYLHSEQKQMVLDNLKDYAVRALVNAVDHLGTVAYKLTDLLEQQAVEVSTMELKVSCANQQLLTCRSYTDKEGLRQQQLLAFIPRHHKHYVLPNSAIKKVHFSPSSQSDARQTQHARSRLQPSGSPAAKTLSWHLASDTKSTLKGSSDALKYNEGQQSSVAFQLLDKADNTPTRSFGVPSQRSSENHPPGVVMQQFGAPIKEMTEGSKPFTAFRSFDAPRRQVVHPPVRSRSMLSSFFVKQKTMKMKAGTVS